MDHDVSPPAIEASAPATAPVPLARRRVEAPRRVGGTRRVKTLGRATVPTLRVERGLLRSIDPGGDGNMLLLAGMDEVGRGALAGPVSVGVALVRVDTRTAPAGVKDSKMLTPAMRQRLVPRLQRWAVASAVGHASAAEIDEVGIMGGLRLAGRRALAAVAQAGFVPDLVLLDGNHDWLTDPEQVGLLGFADGMPGPDTPPVTTMVQGDLRCASVAAASVLAKVERDAMMVELAVADPTHEPYGWALNKGYSAPEHLAALREHGPCPEHRRSWNLRVLAETMGDDVAPGGVAPQSLPVAAVVDEELHVDEC